MIVLRFCELRPEPGKAEARCNADSVVHLSERYFAIRYTWVGDFQYALCTFSKVHYLHTCNGAFNVERFESDCVQFLLQRSYEVVILTAEKSSFVWV